MLNSFKFIVKDGMKCREKPENVGQQSDRNSKKNGLAGMRLTDDDKPSRPACIVQYAYM